MVALVALIFIVEPAKSSLLRRYSCCHQHHEKNVNFQKHCHQCNKLQHRKKKKFVHLVQFVDTIKALNTVFVRKSICTNNTLHITLLLFHREIENCNVFKSHFLDNVEFGTENRYLQFRTSSEKTKDGFCI